VELLLIHDPGLLDLPGFRERTALLAAAGNGRIELVKALLARGADPRWRMHGGGRALDWAAAGGWLEVVEALLAHDPALLELPGDDECTALMMAAGNGHAGIVTALIGRGANVRARMRNGARALDWAAQEGYVGVVKLLLAHDPGLLELPGNYGRTALIAAATDDQVEIVTWLLSLGADARARADDGSRALDGAAVEGHEETVQELLRHDPQLLDLPGAAEATALIVAAGEGHEGVVRVLLAQGADPRKRGADGATAWDRAQEEGHEDLMQLLGSASQDQK
jgi:ankyrin repeat protein